MLRVVDPKRLAEAWLRWQGAPHGERAEVLATEARILGLSASALRAKLKREVAAESRTDRRRKLRSDAGTSAVTRKELELVAGYIRAGSKADGGSNATLDAALLLAWPHLSLVARGLSEATWNRQLQRAGLTKAALSGDRQRAVIVSEHPNHLHVIDATVSWRYYWRPEGGVGERNLALADPQNKPDNAIAIASSKNKLILYTLVDHTSGLIWARYGISRGENTEGVLDLLFTAWTDKGDARLPFRGAPRILYADKGSANRAREITSLCAEFGVHLIHHGTGNAPAGGSVEKAHNIIQRGFEMLMRFSRPPSTLEELNADLYQWLVWFNGVKRHSRTRHTRTAHWAAFIREEHLRLPPADRRDFYSFAYAYSVEASLRSSRMFKAFGEMWALPEGCTWGKGCKLLVRRLAFEPDQLRVVRADTSEEVVAYRRVNDEHGFPANVATSGAHGKGPKVLTDTPAEAMRKAVSVDGLIEQYGHFDRLGELTAQVAPLAFPKRQGTAIEKNPEVFRQPITLMQFKVRLADALGRPLQEEEAAAVAARAEAGAIDARLLPELVAQLRSTPADSAVG